MQIHFFSGKELLCKVGFTDDDVKLFGGREVTFEIAADEQLIGCELYNGADNNGCDFFYGVSWLKLKITN